MGLSGEKEVEEEEPEDEDLMKMTTGMNADEHDDTGRNAALATFKQIQGNIVDDFEQLAADEDRELYHDYLKTNILLWRDKFEDALVQDMPEPTTPEYEAEVGGASREAPEPMEEELFEIVDMQVIDVLEENQRKKR